MKHLDEIAVVDLLDGYVPARKRREIDAHVDGCWQCRRLIEEVKGRQTATAAAWHDIASAPALDVTSPAEVSATVESGDGADAAPTYPAGAMVNHFRVMRLLGRGGMGDVYLARDTQLGRKVALKVIQPRFLGSKDAIKRFQMEARATAKFSHPNIVTIHAVGEHGGKPYVALEYLEGQTLRERMSERQPTFQESVRLAIAIGEALAEAHDHGVLHRDLKPSNVLMGSDGRVRVLDFGMAKIVSTGPPSSGDPFSAKPDDGQHDAGHTTALGTPHYMAPEQWRQSECSPATDVWALGVVLYELLSNKLPFETHTMARLAKAVCGPTEPTPLTELCEVPPVMAELVHRCLAKAEADRPALSEVLEVLQLMLDDRPLSRRVEQSPFRGLLPFHEEHAGLFFGRDAEVAEFVERLRLYPVLALVGPSGAGKSSFISAGVIPRLREQGPCTVLRVRPGARPFAALASRLVRHDPTSAGWKSEPPVVGGDGEDSARDLSEELAATPGALALGLRAIAERRGQRVLLIVDQLEELFTLCDDAELQRRFLQSLCLAADDALDPIRVVVVARDDFLGRIAMSPESRAALAHVTVLSRPTRAQLREILVRPLESVDHAYDDPELVDEMIASVRGEHACLPLLEFAAQMLWDQRDPERRLLLRAAYDRLGGVAGALAKHADGVLEAFTPGQLALARQLLLRLVTAERTRKVVSRERVLEALGDDAALVLDRLVEARLVLVIKSRAEGGAAGETSMLELTHESLVRSWRTLARWIEESEEELAFVAEITQAAELWDRRGRRADELWRHEALADAQRRRSRCRGELPELAVAFLDAARARAEGRARRQRWLIGGAIAASLCVGAAATLAALRIAEERREAVTQRDHAREQRAGALRESARAAAEQGHMLEARAILRMAVEERDSPAARALWWRLDGEPLWWRKAAGTMVYDVAFAADGKRIAAACADGAIRIIDADTRATQLLRGHDDPLVSVALSPDGKLLVAGSWQGDVLWWDLERRERRRSLPGYSKGGRGVAFSPDGALLAVALSGGGFALWSVADDAEQGRITEGGRVLAIDFSDDGRYVASGGYDEQVVVHEVATRQQRWARSGGAKINALRFGADGQLASGGDDGLVRLWDVARGEERMQLHGHAARVQVVAFSRDGRRLASGGEGDVRLWDAQSGEAVRVLRAHEGPVRGLSFSPDGRWLTSSSHDRSVALWRVDTPRLPRADSGHDGGVYGIGFSADGRRLVSGGADHTARVWDVDSGRQLRVLEGHTGDVYSAAFDRQGARIATSSRDKTVRIWDAQSGGERLVLSGHGNVVEKAVFSPDGRLVASASFDHTLRLWDAQTGEPKAVLTGHDSEVLDVAFSPDGSQLATGGMDRSVRLWDVAAGERVARRDGHEGAVYAVAFSPDGAQLASAGADGKVRLWRDDRAQIVGTLPGRAYGVAFHGDGERIGVAGSEREARIWHPPATEPLLLRGHHGEVNDLVFSADGTLCATASDDGTVRTWRVDDGAPFWRAPAMLSSPPRLVTQQGVVLLVAPVPASAPASALERAAADALRASHAGDVTCLYAGGRVRAWQGDAPLAEADAPALSQLVAFAGSAAGCAYLDARGLQLLPAGGAPVVVALDPPPVALGPADGGVLVAQADRVTRYDAAGRAGPSQPVDVGVTALAEIDGEIIVGYREGTLERAGSGFSYEGTPSSPPLRVVAGPQHTLVAGFQNGMVGLWDRQSGALLYRERLHGPVIHLMLAAQHLFAASDLADTLSWDLSVFDVDHCALLERIWREVPVVWRDGRAVTAAAPPGRCAHSSSREQALPSKW